MSNQAANDMYSDASKKYQNAISEYTGNKGYENSLKEGQKGAASAAGGAASAAQGSARTAGMSKSAAAAMGNQSTINSYDSNLASQQQQAANQGNAKVSAQSGALNAGQAEAGNEYNRGWSTAGNIMGMVGGALSSDERMKNYKDVSSKLEKNKPVDFSSLKINYKPREKK
jgi:hypothetical protein